LTFDASLTLNRNVHDMPRSDQDAYGYYIQSILGSPLTVREGPDGELAGGLLFGTSTLESLSSITSRVSALRSTPSVQVRYSPTHWLSNRLTVGADLTQGRGFQMFPRNDFGWYPDRAVAGNGDVTTTQNDDRRYTVDYAGNIRTAFGADGQYSSNLSFGTQYIHHVVNQLAGSGAGLVTNSAILVGNTASSTVGQSYGESKALGAFVQQQIGYHERLFVQLGMRADRNSAFGSEVGTFFLPKLGASYVISEEPFWESAVPIVSTLRLRAAYGTTGRSPTSAAALRTFATARYVTDAGVVQLGVAPGSPGNPDLRPERGTEIEVGFDAGILDDRIGAELTYFDKTTTDLLVTVPVAPSSGFGASPFGNIGEIRNRGVEFLVRGTPIRRESAVWDLAVSGSTLHNEIVSLGTAGTFINNFRAFVPGRQIAAWWVHQVRSVDEAAGVVVVSDTAEFAGNQLPTFQGNLTSTVTLFRNVSVYALLSAKTGYHVYNLNQEFRDRAARASREVNLGADEGGYSAHERLRRLGPYVTEGAGSPVGAGNVKDPYIQKGDHVRLQEVSATLSLPTAFARRLGAHTASITMGGRNLALWASEFEGDDPDVLGTGAQPTGILQFYNVDVFTTPPSRRWMVRMNLQF
jgi:TonB-dependent starch-binding outer membrane protein SusC